METLGDLPVLQFASPRQWEEWLDAHHAEPRGVWLKIAKKGTGIASVSHAEALDGALCYGWIDGLRKPCDKQFFLKSIYRVY